MAFLHEILHTHTRHVAIGDPVVAGQLIGTMGNTGVDPVNPKKGAYHVHYQLSDRDGNRVNPTDFWDRQGSADPNPAPPAYLGEYRQYLLGLGANAFGSTPHTASMPAPGSFDAPSDKSPSLAARQTTPRLARRIVDKSQSFFDTGTPAVPFVPPNNVLSSDRQNSFGNRFGNWTSSSAAPPNAVPSADRPNSLGDRFASPPQTAGSMPERRLGRSTYSVSRAPLFDTGAPAVPFISSDDANYLAGQLDRLAAMAGIAPQSVNQPKPSPDDEQEQADLQALETRLSSSGNINDAWALYKARMASRTA